METEVSGVRTDLMRESLGRARIRNWESHLSALGGAITMNFSAFPLRTVQKQMGFLIVWSSCVNS